MKFVKLTNANGDDVWISTQWIQMVGSPLPVDKMGDDPVNAVVILSGHRLAVRETVAQVIALC